MKLKQMESSTGIWTMRCLLIVEGRHIIVIDKGNGVGFSISYVLPTKGRGGHIVFSADPNSTYMYILADFNQICMDITLIYDELMTTFQSHSQV